MGKPITADRVRELLSYDPLTGIFRWRQRRSGVRSNLDAGHAHRRGYRAIGIDGGRYHAHRLAWLYMTGEWPKDEIDHINRNTADNRWLNLRSASHKENQSNRGVQKNNSSGFKGVGWDKHSSKWRAQICKNGKRLNLGRFETAEAAYFAYCTKAYDLFGDFARVA